MLFPRLETLNVKWEKNVEKQASSPVRVDPRVLFYRRNADFANCVQEFATIASRLAIHRGKKKNEKEIDYLGGCTYRLLLFSQNAVPVTVCYSNFVSVVNASTQTRESKLQNVACVESDNFYISKLVISKSGKLDRFVDVLLDTADVVGFLVFVADRVEDLRALTIYTLHEPRRRWSIDLDQRDQFQKGKLEQRARSRNFNKLRQTGIITANRIM